LRATAATAVAAPVAPVVEQALTVRTLARAVLAAAGWRKSLRFTDNAPPLAAGHR
jgi:hypothetical protein